MDKEQRLSHGSNGLMVLARKSEMEVAFGEFSITYTQPAFQDDAFLCAVMCSRRMRQVRWLANTMLLIFQPSRR